VCVCVCVCVMLRPNVETLFRLTSCSTGLSFDIFSCEKFSTCEFKLCKSPAVEVNYNNVYYNR
jgi:hypothetical protein